RKWSDNLKEAQHRGLVLPNTATLVQEKFDAFSNSYSAAIKGFAAEGLAYPSLMDQAKAYADLLDIVCRLAKGDRCRELLLKPIIQVGVVAVFGGHRPAAIVAP